MLPSSTDISVADLTRISDTDIRKNYDLVIWLTLSSAPNITKLQSLMHQQITGTGLPDGVTSGEATEKLTEALLNTKTLLVLDDVWEADADRAFSTCIDRSSGSKTLVTTRIKGLLSASEQVEVGLPSEEDSMKLLMRSAHLKGVEPPPEAAEIVQICGRLPYVTLSCASCGMQIAAVLGLLCSR